MLVYCDIFTILSSENQYNVSKDFVVIGRRMIADPGFCVEATRKTCLFNTIIKGV